jgi:hypothetical protein
MLSGNGREWQILAKAKSLFSTPEGFLTCFYTLKGVRFEVLLIKDTAFVTKNIK